MFGIRRGFRREIDILWRMGIGRRDYKGNWVVIIRRLRVKFWEYGVMKVKGRKSCKKVGVVISLRDMKCIKCCWKV